MKLNLENEMTSLPLPKHILFRVTLELSLMSNIYHIASSASEAHFSATFINPTLLKQSQS